MILKDLKQKLNDENEDLLMYCPIPRSSSISMSHFIGTSDKVFTYRDYESDDCWFQPYVTCPPTYKTSDDSNDWGLLHFISGEQTFFINRLSEIRQGFCKNIFEHDSKKVFSIVRNPVDRLFSIWNYCTNSNHEAVLFSLTKKEEEYKIKDFNEFVKEFATNGLPEKYPSRMFLGMNDILDVNLDNKLKIFKLENLKECSNFLRGHYNIKGEHPHHNESKKIEKNITDTTIELIKNLYKKDFERFGY